ncbi:MAG: AAA family ATPase [Lachnospiraceae bacterium]|nr:AAA family ATPase [Lachnospiraceae bacterium]
MYLDKICIRNTGPLDKIDITANFDAENPKPIIFVGENGTGKTTILSSLLDAFYEFAGRHYHNVLLSDSKLNLGYYYLKKISPNDIKLNKKFLYSAISFSENNDEVSYLSKNGEINFDLFQSECKLSEKFRNNFNEKKVINCNKNIVKEIFEKNIACYFGSDRYEIPYWMSENYAKRDNKYNFVKDNFDNFLYNDIIITSVNKQNQDWLLDIIIDSMISLDEVNLYGSDKKSLEEKYLKSRAIFLISKNKIENVISTILSKEVLFSINNRSNKANNRLCIKDKNKNIVVPSFECLSTGQLALFNIFATIIRYSDNNNLINSAKNDDISGIVLIDEIDLHLNASLLRLCVPKLLKLFPKIQFIITTHSPMFLLGMDDVYGKDGYDVYQLPEGKKIKTENFLELQKSFEFLTCTDIFKEKVIKEINNVAKKKFVILTEGKTDWKHLKSALKYLNLDNKKFEFYENENSFGDTRLLTFLRDNPHFEQQVVIIGIFDRDNFKKLKCPELQKQEYIKFNKNVYAFAIPESKIKTYGEFTSIEHYYQKKHLLKKDKNGRRLFLGSEFNESGVSKNKKYLCRMSQIQNKVKINGIVDEYVMI